MIARFSAYIASAIILSVTIIISGCAGKITSPEDLNSGNSSPSVQLSKFSDIQKSVFTPTCALSGCHGNTNTKANLNLTEGNAYNSLVNRQSILYPEFKRVLPNSSTSSVLIKVLSGTVSTVMPPAGKLNQSIVDSIAAWINRGAPND